MDEITDQVIDEMARAMWNSDMEAHGYDAERWDASFERSKDIYRRRALAAAEVLTGTTP